MTEFRNEISDNEETLNDAGLNFLLETFLEREKATKVRRVPYNALIIIDEGIKALMDGPDPLDDTIDYWQDINPKSFVMLLDPDFDAEMLEEHKDTT